MLKLIGLLSLIFVTSDAFALMCACRSLGNGIECTAPTGYGMYWPNGTRIPVHTKVFRTGCYNAIGEPAAPGEIGTELRRVSYMWPYSNAGLNVGVAGWSAPTALYYCKADQYTAGSTQPSEVGGGTTKSSCSGSPYGIQLRGCVGNIQSNVECNYCYKSIGVQPNGATAYLSWSCGQSNQLSIYDGCYDAAGQLVKTGGTHLRTYSCSNSAGSTVVKRCGNSLDLIFEKRTPCQYGCSNGACNTSPTINPASTN